MEVSISSEAQFGMTWPIWKQFSATVESLGFDGLFRSDHFTIQPAPPDEDALELITSLTYVADRTQRIHFGSLVAPLSMRDAVMLARQAAALDDLSGGRMVLGIGAGWNEREHAMFGYPLGDKATRLSRFEEGVQVIASLLRSGQPVTHSGRFYQLREAMLLPQPTRPGGPRILIGGNGLQRTLPLAARFADVWNGDNLDPQTFRERSALLDDLAHKAGRHPTDIKRSVTLFIVCGRNAAENERRVRVFRRFLPQHAHASVDDVRNGVRADMNALVGTPAEVVEQIHALRDAGVQELMLHWNDTVETDGLQLIAEEVLPHVR